MQLNVSVMEPQGADIFFPLNAGSFFKQRLKSGLSGPQILGTVKFIL